MLYPLYTRTVCTQRDVINKGEESCGTSVSNPHECRLFLLSGLIQFQRERMRRYLGASKVKLHEISSQVIQESNMKLLLMWFCPKVRII